jgi:hypothetical protein
LDSSRGPEELIQLSDLRSLTERYQNPQEGRGVASGGIRADFFVCRQQTKEIEEKSVILFADNRQRRDG